MPAHRENGKDAVLRNSHCHPFVCLFGLACLFAGISSLWDIQFTEGFFLRSLNRAQQTAFESWALPLYNGVAYPVCLALGAVLVWPLFRCLRDLRAGKPVDPKRMVDCRRKVLCLPARAVGLVILGWLPLPILFPVAIGLGGDWQHGQAIWWHFALSFGMGTLATAQTYFLLEAYVLGILCPLFYDGGTPEEDLVLLRLPRAARRALFWVSTTAMPVLPVMLASLQGVSTGRLDLRQFQLLYTLAGLAYSALTFWAVSRSRHYRLGV